MRLDSTGNPRALTKLPDCDEALGPESTDCVEEMAMMLHYDSAEILDEARLLACTRREVRSIVRWIAYRTAAASDNIVRKKSLEQPSWSIGVVKAT